ncbi:MULTISPECIES: carbon starvation CstA family protein [Pseudoxanthomonas]|uniref:Carbon starvation protein A n=2 Tax=Pseudoxanthomonas winnipegensis TaxID=2480810 RepID=A0A4Q8L9N0_9GAMM|nr:MULTISPECIES: carbon starvation CstA family protein [Pseudoxanthomonas]MDQ1118477.1 carbon starvation protein CstA [Pseudoxanthomonas winnipegensis]MDQ1131661.1 carbon starvation protein CstA [Pseudoxanthomonas winnipegensis]MDR6138320.1 carbon starvation protein CstA [Pseudoxanthomonas sp. SORGH_AS_0997]RZZ82315.1 carbon starvation protein A [Pseudoxanthomonas winnipegensis]RZZ86639.1 carbon starvation protein A [Pseudoxanthomonas winnipegensis]
MKGLSKVAWALLALLGAFCLGTVALRRGETVNALWIVVAAVSLYLVAYRYYALFIANKVMRLDPTRATPAVLRNDGLDYVPTNKHVLFGHHFAAIAGAGPLVGPVLAAQMGYLPGLLWLVLGVVFAGAVQDFMVLFISSRRDARSLGDLVREEMGQIPGTIALFGAFLIMIIILGVLAMVVVNALAESPWGTFTVFATMPIAILMGLYMRYIRPGKIGEISVVGLVLLLAAIWLGGKVAADPSWGPALTFTKVQITWMMIGYGFVASVLPVWLLLAPRDYLSTFLKIGTIIALAIGILIVMPDLKMPALTEYAHTGKGPVWTGGLFPFLFITIACGAVSGFHALISSGTTPKLLANEAHMPYIGYGGMLMESFVAIMALVAACIIDPGVYFAMNAPPAVVGTDVVAVAAKVSEMGFVITPDVLTATAKDIGESTILNRAGGAPTLAVGIAQILHAVLPTGDSMGFWYHFAILFEALFILTAVDAGTRSGRFMLQDLIGNFVPAMKRTESWTANIIATAGCVALWGYLLHSGVTDPFGGIKTLWPLFGISNQMLAGIALLLGTVVLFKLKRDRYAWVCGIPALWLLACTTTAGLIKLFDSNPGQGFLAQAHKFQDAIGRGEVLAPAKSMAEMHKVVVNAYVNTALTTLFLLVVAMVLVYSIKAILVARRNPQRSDRETEYVALTPAQMADL